jgi:hypothetical protein
MKNRLYSLTTLTAATAALVFTGCGSDDDNGGGGGPAGVAAPAPTATVLKASAGARMRLNPDIKIVSGTLLEYSNDETDDTAEGVVGFPDGDFPNATYDVEEGDGLVMVIDLDGDPTTEEDILTITFDDFRASATLQQYTSFSYVAEYNGESAGSGEGDFELGAGPAYDADPEDDVDPTPVDISGTPTAEQFHGLVQEGFISKITLFEMDSAFRGSYDEEGDAFTFNITGSTLSEDGSKVTLTANIPDDVGDPYDVDGVAHTETETFSNVTAEFADAEDEQGYPTMVYSYDYTETTTWPGDSSSYSGSIDGSADLMFDDFFSGMYSYNETDTYEYDGESESYEESGTGEFEIE